jgi:hypothetical protein
VGSVASERADLERLVLEARRRANRRVLLGAVTLGLVPALGAAVLVRLASLLASASPPAAIEGALVVLGILGGVVLHRFRRLTPAEAALLLDRRAGTRERCVTGLRGGGRVARDALARVDRSTVRAALDFRPPRSVLAALLAGGALVALHLLPAVGPAPEAPGPSGLTEVRVRGTGNDSPDGAESDEGARSGAPAPEEPEHVLRLIHQAEAPEAEGATAEDLRAARKAMEANDCEAARAALEKALASAEDGDGGEEAARRIARALDAAGGAATGRGPVDPVGRVAWGEDADLVRRYLLLLEADRSR